jgi:hypothetical protein
MTTFMVALLDVPTMAAKAHAGQLPESAGTIISDSRAKDMVPGAIGPVYSSSGFSDQILSAIFPGESLTHFFKDKS